MAAPIPLWADYDGMMHRRLAKASSDAIRTRRLLALAEIYDGGARSDAARIAASLLWTRSSATGLSQTRDVGETLRGEGALVHRGQFSGWGGPSVRPPTAKAMATPQNVAGSS